MTRSVRRDLGDALSDLDATAPELAAEIRAHISARRVRDDLADAEALLREQARTDPTSVGRALSVLLVEYERRGGKVVREPIEVRSAPRVVLSTTGRAPSPTELAQDRVSPAVQEDA